MKKLLPVLLCIIVCSSSCKKDDAPAAAASPFLVTSAGSTWKYESKDVKTGIVSTYTVKATAKDTLVGTRNYKVYTNSATGSDYYSQSGTDYFQFSSLPGLPTRVELLYLKDAALNSKWEDNQSTTFMTYPATVKLTYTVVEKGGTKTIGSKTYTDVTHISVAINSITISGIPLTPTTSVLDYYYARGIGRISSNTKIILAVPLNPTIDVEDQTNLVDYTIL